ncbi:hypothetical protein PG996_008625 [Apiospora saccharicola]|uniref:Zn(2)-C6 fungal-type domain-containing protein n=1 Tax=Apiospora saccharicola TaxID=335842 RepID=A0ABR1UYG5_9PEZI
MVGVKGKYKGCNTCRVRRVKSLQGEEHAEPKFRFTDFCAPSDGIQCDNTRPFCKKCTDHGRVCEGYERETVFIVGTVDDKGRCASHPPRNLGPSQSSSHQANTAFSSSSPSPSRAGSRKKQAKAEKAKAAEAAAIGSSFSSSPSSSAASPQLSLRETASASPSAFVPVAVAAAAGCRGRGNSFGVNLGGLGGGGGGGSVSDTIAAEPVTTVTTPLEPLEPLMPAWDDGDAVALVSAPPGPPAAYHQPSFYRVRFLALRTQQLDAVLKSLDPMTPEGQLTLTLPSTRHRDVGTAAAMRDEVGFRLSAQCFVHVPLRGLGGGGSGGGGGGGGGAMTMHHDHAGGSGLEYGSTGGMSDGVCLFLYEHNASAARSSNQPPWRDPTILADPILSLGPLHFQSFPSHHLFARVYRPNAIMTSLLARTPCHLASPEWTTVPYERHPKSSLDALLDVIAFVPSLLHRADRVLPLLPPAALGRRLKARDLLANCVNIEAQLARWSAGIEAAAAGNRDMPLLYWIHGTLNLGGGGGGGGRGQMMMEGHGHGQRHAQIPFADTYDFASTVVGLGHVYYWTSLMLLYECMAALVDAVLYDGGGSGSGSGGSGTITSTTNNNPFTDLTAGAADQDLLPPGCEAARYQVRERRKLAAHICRSLDWVVGSSPLLVPGRGGGGVGRGGEEEQWRLRSLLDAAAVGGHPDLALGPLHVVERFYGALWSPDGRDGELERGWCRDFRTRLGQRGREVEGWVGGRGGRGWVEVGRFG